MKNDKLDLMVIQTLLQLNNQKIKATGIFDMETQTAIENFQKDTEKMLAPTGSISPESTTLVRLEKALGITYEIADSSVVLGQGVEAAIKPLAIRFYCNSVPHHKMVITSGVRTAAAQAQAMFKKLEMKDDIIKLYLNKKAAKEVVDTYDESKKANDPANTTVNKITAVLEKQIANKVYISSHFNAKAFDMRSRDLDAHLVELFKKVSDGFVRKLIHEGKPPHLHLEMF